ncbi:glycosyltransferase [Paenibacillus vulneris]|uniref:Glycosyltransferase n=1 Tax=Paenibacillus vulneris TaxID=1133364 RepID=A0ABW3UR91_9BACL
MRILIWSSMVSVGGGCRLLANLVTAIARQPNIQLVRVVISAQTGFKDRIQMREYNNIEIYYEEQDIRSDPNHPYLRDCHVVYAFWPHGPQFVDVKKPVVCTFHDATILDFAPPFVGGSVIRAHWQQYAVWFERSAKVVVPSEHVKSRIIAHFGERCRSATIIRHAILPMKPTVDPALNASLATMLPFPYFVYPANTSPHKNHYNLLLGYNGWANRHQHPLVLFGYGTEKLGMTPPNWPDAPYQSTLISLIHRLGLKPLKDIYPLGLVPDSYVAPVIKNAYALIMPSLSEGGGSYPVEEALTLGVPVLCSDIPVMREHLSNRSADVVWFDPESPDSITRAFEHLAGHYDHYKNSAIAGMNDPSASWDDIAKQYIAVFYDAFKSYYSA